jgi:peptidoglycan/xylan/chitin deacetylase (PgdA/CDA1 family)
LKRTLFSLFIIILIIFGGGVYVLSSSFFQKSYSTEQITLPPLPNGFNSIKLIIIAFDDSSRTQFTLAKPVLDKYGFKGSFFTV